MLGREIQMKYMAALTFKEFIAVLGSQDLIGKKIKNNGRTF